MRKSDRYGLNLVEGSDIVNPLVQDVPNYEIIDEEMGKNADAGVPLATELLSGTVHALTRENPNASMFRFVATAKYTSGDTFTVDGVQVSALLTTGEPLATGCYVINSNVLCCLVGTVLTMFCANSLAEIRAVDSERLGGEEAKYYAKTADVTQAINLAQDANDISISNRNAIAKLSENLNFRVYDYETKYVVNNDQPHASLPPVTIENDGIIVASVSTVSDKTYSYGISFSELYINGELVHTEGVRISDNSQLNHGSSFTRVINVKSGDVLTSKSSATKNGTHTHHLNLLCIGCLVKEV